MVPLWVPGARALGPQAEELGGPWSIKRTKEIGEAAVQGEPEDTVREKGSPMRETFSGHRSAPGPCIPVRFPSILAQGFF